MKEFIKYFLVAVLVLGAFFVLLYVLNTTDILSQPYRDYVTFGLFIVFFLGGALFFAYRNQKSYKKRKINRKDSKNLAKWLDNNEALSFENTNFIIQKNQSQNDVVNVENDVFWLDEEAFEDGIENDMMKMLIEDFKKFCSKNKALDNYLKGKIIEFSLIDNVNFDHKELEKKRIEYNHLQNTQ